jgi:hypothetical protein
VDVLAQEREQARDERRVADLNPHVPQEDAASYQCSQYDSRARSGADPSIELGPSSAGVGPADTDREGVDVPPTVPQLSSVEHQGLWLRAAPPPP